MTVASQRDRETHNQSRASRLLAILHTGEGESRHSATNEDDAVDAARQFSRLSLPTRFDIVHTLSSVDTSLGRALAVHIVQSDPSPLVRHEAAFVIGCIGGPQELVAVRDALENDVSPLVRHEAAMAIAEIGGDSELSLLRACLSDDSEEVAVSCEVAIARIEDREGQLIHVDPERPQ